MTWFSEKWMVMFNNLNWDFIHENNKSDFRLLWYQVSQVTSAGMEAPYPLKCWYLPTEPHRLISQKTVVWLLTCFQLCICFPCYSFLTSFGIYFLIGIAYKRMIEGAKGLEQIPHQKFWKELGNLQAVCWHYRNLEMKILRFSFLCYYLINCSVCTRETHQQVHHKQQNWIMHLLGSYRHETAVIKGWLLIEE